MANIGVYKLDQSLFLLGVGLDPASFIGHVIHKQVLPQIIGSGEEDTTFAGFCHLHNKSARQLVCIKHESVDSYTALRAPFCFSERQLERAQGRRELEEKMPVLNVGCRLAVGYQYYLLVVTPSLAQESSSHR